MPKLEEGWLTLGLICTLSFIAASAVEACQWADGLWTAWFTGFLGVLTGLALAKSAFGGKTAALYALVYGFFCVGLFIGFTLPGDWHERSTAVVVRMATFASKLIFGGASRDALPFPVLIATLFWVFGVTGAWQFYRHGAIWPAILPNGLMLVINAYYYLGGVDLNVYLAVYVLVALLLLGQTHLLLREREWQRAGVHFNPELRFEFLRAGLTVALVGTLAAWATPEIQAAPGAATLWQQTNTYWTGVRENWLRLFSGLRGYGQTSEDFYGDALALAGPSVLGDKPIMDVAITPLIGEDETDLVNQPRYYWRATVYERYADGQWQLGDDSVFREVPAGGIALPLARYRLRREVNAVFTMRVASTSRLYVVPQPKLVALSDNLSVIYTVLESPDNSVDAAVARAREPLAKGKRSIYRATGSVSIADEDSLRGAGADYPLWVTAHYLQLPPEITDRTRQLAREIVDSAGARTPYDQAQAVTEWLRANITYDTQIAAPPADQEPVDWLLYTSRRGYCNYYASAEVVLLRSLGIPARLAVGFSQGTYEEAADATFAGTYHVVEKNAHAWVEVFFPNYGWVEFEPTVSEAPLVRPVRPADTAGSEAPNPDTPRPTPTKTPAGPATPDEPQDTATGNLPWGVIGRTAALIAGGVLAIVIAAVALLLRLGLIGWESLGPLGEWVMRRRHALPSPIGAIYLRLERAGRWLGLPLPPTLTPHERAEAVGRCVPPARPGVDAITAQYVREQYSPHPAHAGPARAAWRAIRLNIWREGVRRFLLSFIKDDAAPDS